MCFQIEKYVDNISYNKFIFVCLFVLCIKMKLLVVLKITPHLNNSHKFFGGKRMNE